VPVAQVTKVREFRRANDDGVRSGDARRMTTTAADDVVPSHVIVVGAGMVGLSTAWFLQEHGIRVTVVEREGVAAGASWGNAGWLTPGITTPLPDPAVLAYGVRAVLSPSSPVYVPPSLDPDFLRFVLRFTRNSTMARWREAMTRLVPINGLALAAFDRLADAGVAATTREARTFIAAYRTAKEREGLLAELEHIHDAGQAIEFEQLTGEAARELEPSLSGEIGAVLLLRGQRFIDPGTYVAALADSVRARGGEILEGVTVERLTATSNRVIVSGGEPREADAVVVATGAWLGDLVRPFGVRQVVQAGRGYSFSVPVEHLPTGPVYFPAARVACTPLGDRLRVAGMMEFRPAGAPLDRRRIKAIVDSARPLLRGVDLDDRQDEWVGARPCTADGLPLIGRTRSPRVFVAGGHGMWGITLGPATGQLLAETIAKGQAPEELAPFDPLR